VLNDEEARLAYYRQVLSSAASDPLPAQPTLCDLLGCEPTECCS
jgi:hypothetical protein